MNGWKKPDILIRAMKDVLKQVPNAHAVIIGDGPQKQELQELVDELQLKDKVTIAGAVFEEELLGKYFLVSKVAVIPAAAGLAVQHAFGYALPIIVGDDMNSNGPEVELVVDGVTGLICPDGDVKAFSSGICRLLSNETERKRMSENALNVILKKHNVENMAKGLLEAVINCEKIS